MNNFEFQKLMNAKKLEEKSNFEGIRQDDLPISEVESIDDKVYEDEIDTIEEIQQLHNFNRTLNNINISNENSEGEDGEIH